jgi:hypothetical protein
MRNLQLAIFFILTPLLGRSQNILLDYFDLTTAVGVDSKAAKK